IGHMVGPVIFDTIKRFLTYSGYQVTWVVNITDVDDKLIGQMHERGIPMSEIAEEMTVDYLNNLRALGVDQIDKMPRATEHMAGIIEFTKSLIEKGFAYAGRSDREAPPGEAGGKLSRSGGAGGLADDIARLSGERIRFFLLRTHYRSTVMFGEEGLEEAATALESFYRYFERFHKITKQRYF